MTESGRTIEGKLMIERALPGDQARRATSCARSGSGGRGGGADLARSLSVNLAESPLGWLFARGHVSERQFQAGERLRWDWERAQLDPQVTMRWDASPMQRGRGGRQAGCTPSTSQLDARERFAAAVKAVGPGMADIVWRIICAGEGMRQAEEWLRAEGLASASD